MSRSLLEVSAAVLSAVGLGISLAMERRSRALRAGQAGTVESRTNHGMCPAGEEVCTSVLATPQARLAGVPNSVVGAAYYLVVLGALGAWRLTGQARWVRGALAASLGAVGVGAYLGHALLFRLRLSCRLCWTAHATNAVLTGLLAAILRQR